MAAALPNIEDDPTARNEGTAAHWAAKCIFDGINPETLIDRKAPNGFVVTGEMLDYVNEYLAALDCGEMEIETTFAGHGWAVKGRADHIKFSPNTVIGYINGGNGNVLEDTENILTIDDFKYGFRIVEPEYNWTLIAHAIGYCIARQIQPATIIFRIHQPRPWHPGGKMREWRITYQELMNFYALIDDHLRSKPDELNTGPHCAKCRAEATCPARRLSSMNAIDASSAVFSDDMPNDDLEREMILLEYASKVIESRLTALKELATYKASNGAVFLQHGLQPQYAQTRWKPGLDGKILTVMTGIDCVKPATITPAEFKRRGGSESVMKSLTERPMTGTKLVRVDPDKLAKQLLRK